MLELHQILYVHIDFEKKTANSAVFHVALGDPWMLDVQIPFFRDDISTIKHLLKYNGVLNQFGKIHYPTLSIEA